MNISKSTVLILVLFLIFNSLYSQRNDTKVLRFTYEESLAGDDKDKTANDTITVAVDSAANSLQIDSLSLEGQVTVTDSLSVTENVSADTSMIAADTTSLALMESKSEQIPEPEEEPAPSNWEKGGQTALNFSQISLSNWAAGGTESFSFNSYLNLFARYKSPDGGVTWENTLDLGFGKIKQSDKPTVKSDDKIDFSTKYGRRASENWFYSSLFNFRTQMAPGFKKPEDPKISDFLAPAFISLSLGMDHKFDENLNFYLSPLAGKITLVYDEELTSNYGVEDGENVKYEFGGFVRVQFRATLMENITVTSRLELFSNYADKPQNFDVNSDTRINMQVNRYISANLLLQMMYDESTRVNVFEEGVLVGTTGPRVQIKQVFGLGFSYRF
ncbi:MAG: DUF3078 domain-containing protein [Bacteroidales bacterium]